MNTKELSKAMYKKCKNGNDNKEYWSLITDPQQAYYYCKYVEDREEVRNTINTSKWAYKYCVYVENRPEIRKNITDPILRGMLKRLLLIQQNTCL